MILGLNELRAKKGIIAANELRDWNEIKDLIWMSL